MSTRSGVTPTLIGGNVPRRMARIPAGGSARPNSCSISLSSLRTSSKSLVSKLPNRFPNMALLLVDDTGDLEIGAVQRRSSGGRAGATRLFGAGTAGRVVAAVRGPYD